nr:ATP citrate synthase [Hymenolepis microstoma]
MSIKSIYEYSAKQIIKNALRWEFNDFSILITSQSELDSALTSYPFLGTLKLVCKVDQLVKRRGKLGLIICNENFDEVKQWIFNRINKQLKIGSKTDTFKRFLIEPFVPHTPNEEHYLCMYTRKEGDFILFCAQGGIDVGDIDSKARRFLITNEMLETPGEAPLPLQILQSDLLKDIQDASRQSYLSKFISELHRVFSHLHINYLEINPLVACLDSQGNLRIHILDVASKIDQCAEYLFSSSKDWSVNGEPITFPPAFGQILTSEEQRVADLDARTGASLKLCVLNPHGRIWTMSAGGGASVIYADTICQLVSSPTELANYGEYSGAPTEAQTFEYASTILHLMTNASPPHPLGKILLIGGGIANFTNVAATFRGIIRAITDYQDALRAHAVKIYVRRGGPNYQEGLHAMQELGQSLRLPIFVFGPETHMTAVVAMALGITETHANLTSITAPSLFDRLPHVSTNNFAGSACSQSGPKKSRMSSVKKGEIYSGLFSRECRAIIWGVQLKAIQSMLDFDYACCRTIPSVAAIVYPFAGDCTQKFYWGSKDNLFIPQYQSLANALNKHIDARFLVNFASFRAAYDITMKAISMRDETGKRSRLDGIAIIAEGIPERLARRIMFVAKQMDVVVIGPATVGAIKPGCFKIGNTAGMIDNIIASKLHRPGSVAYVSRSGGMSNELNNIISRNTDGVAEGVAIGGDQFPGSTFLDHILRYEADPGVSMIVLLGEVGGLEEYSVSEAIENGEIKKPLVAWCIGTCAEVLAGKGDTNSPEEVQFGHAGACARSQAETAVAKNERLAKAGAFVPNSFNDLGHLIRKVYEDLVKSGILTPKPDFPPQTVPMDYSWAKELRLVRKPAAFTSTISDDRGSELLYAGMPVSRVLSDNLGIGGVISLLWFKKRLPDYAIAYIERCLIIAADHGPAVSGAHNTIVAARADKDLVSSLASGLLTIGNRFGGAIDAAARQFSEAFDAGQSPSEFVASSRAAGRLIMGIGHRIKSVNNPDTRVILLAQFARANFPATPLIDYAFQVEKLTTAKRPTLILNVDGLIGVSMVDLLRNCNCFTREEADEHIRIGALNGLFVLARSIGFIGHYLDQKRLRQGLYRHPWDDITYQLPDLDDSDFPSTSGANEDARVPIHPHEDRIYGIELISPEPFVVRYPNDSPIQAVIPRSVSPIHAGNMRSSSVHRGRQIAAHRPHVSQNYRRSKTPVRRSPSPQSKAVHRSHSADKKSKAIRRRPGTGSFAKHDYDDERETVVDNGGRYIYVNPEYIQRYHRSHGSLDSFSSSGTIEKNHYHGNDVFEYNDA